MYAMALRTAQANLAPRGIICQRVEPYRDGRCRYGVWPRDRKFLARYSDDVEEVYIMGLGLAR